MFLETPIEELAKHLDADVLAPAILLQKLLPVMLEQEGGIVVNMSSFVVFNDPPGPPDKNGWALGYASAKAGIDRFAGALNAEFGDRGILAYTVDPGFVAYGDAFADQVDRYVGHAGHPARRDRRRDRVAGHLTRRPAPAPQAHLPPRHHPEVRPAPGLGRPGFGVPGLSPPPPSMWRSRGPDDTGATLFARAVGRVSPR